MLPKLFRLLLWLFVIATVASIVLSIFFPRLLGEVDRAVRIAAVVLLIAALLALLWHGMMLSGRLWP